MPSCGGGTEIGMAYKSERMQRLSTLFGVIEAHKKNEHSPPTYKDTPALREIANIVSRELSETSPDNRSTYDDTVIILRYLAEAYDAIGRYSISAYYYTKLIGLESNMKLLFGIEYPEVQKDFLNALKVRNIYSDDNADDLAALAAPIIPAEQIKERLVLIKARRRSFLRDSVEASNEYLMVIDAVEDRIEKTRKTYGRGACTEVWKLKKQYLLEYGVKWSSPAELNPRLDFSTYDREV